MKMKQENHVNNYDIDPDSIIQTFDLEKIYNNYK